MKTLEKLPTHAGGVPLHFSDQQFGIMPERTMVPGQPSSLVIPKRAGMEFHPLKGGEQFLLIYPGTPTWRGVEGRTFFGGMDESPFITALEAPATEAFRWGGEEAFFSALVPRAIKTLKEKFPDASVRRQGDVWSIKLPTTWEELRTDIRPPVYVHVSGRRRFRIQQRNRNRNLLENYNRTLQQFSDGSRRVVRVLGTENHELTGRSISGNIFKIAGLKIGAFGATVMAEGTLTAPDHAPHELTGSPHLLARTPHISPLWLNGGD